MSRGSQRHGCAVTIEERRGDRARAAARSGHQGVCAEVARIPTPMPMRCCGAAPLIVALDQVQDPAEPRCDLPQRGVRGRRGRGPARAPRSRGDASGLQGIGRRRRAPAGRAGAQPRRLPRRRPNRAGLWCYGADARRRGRATTRSTTRGGVVLVLGSEGRGLRPRVAGGCDALSRSRCAAGSSRSVSARRPRCCCTPQRGGTLLTAAVRACRRLTAVAALTACQCSRRSKDQLELEVGRGSEYADGAALRSKKLNRCGARGGDAPRAIPTIPADDGRREGMPRGPILPQLSSSTSG